VRELLVPVEEELYAPETRLFGLELEAPFDILRGLCACFECGGRVIARGGFAVADLGGYFVRCDAWMSCVSFFERGMLRC
jgi:hypothetical protein